LTILFPREAGRDIFKYFEIKAAALASYQSLPEPHGQVQYFHFPFVNMLLPQKHSANTRMPGG
jgi:hypothetical protein